MNAVSQSAEWYVRKGSRVSGPYTEDEVICYLLMGRIKNTDEVSQDGMLWEPVTQVPQLVPDELLELGDYYGKEVESCSSWNSYLVYRVYCCPDSLIVTAWLFCFLLLSV